MDLLRELRHAARGLLAAPAFTATAVAVLALGLGANLAIASVVYAVIVRPLPFPDADRLVNIYERIPASETPNGRERRAPGLEVRDLLAIREHARTLSHITVQRLAVASVVGSDAGVQLMVTGVSAEAFDMLGATAALGRVFTADDEQPGRDRVVVLSDSAWRRYFNRDPSAIGATLAFNGNAFSTGIALGEAYEVVGVMPPTFTFPDAHTAFWVPTALAPLNDGRPRRLTAMARLAAQATPELAARELEQIRLDSRSLTRTAGAASRYELILATSEVGTQFRPALSILMTAVAFVLVIAAANVTSLLLVRNSARAREFAIRIAVGASRSQLVRQLLVESLLIAIAGGVVGIALAVASLSLFRRLATDLGRIDLGALGNSFPRLEAIELSWPVLFFGGALVIAIALSVTLLPALTSFRRTSGLAQRASSGRHRSRGATMFSSLNLLVVVEVALAMVLLVGGALMARTFRNLAQVNTGFDASHVLTFQVGLPGRRPPDALKAFADTIVGRARAIPGVSAAGYANQVPMVSLENSMTLHRTIGSTGQPTANAPDVRLISRQYLTAMGIRVVAGRPFTDADSASAPRVLIINRTLAQRDFADVNPVGLTVYPGREEHPYTIVGIVDDVRQAGQEVLPRPQHFLLIEQWTMPDVPLFPAGAYYAIRTSGDPLGIVADVRSQIRAFAPEATMENIATMEQIVANRLRRPQLYAALLGAFALVALGIAATGLYGVVSFVTARETRQIGIRLALGAPTWAVMVRTIVRSLALTGVGLVFGVVAAWWTSQVLSGLLYGVTPAEWSTYVMAGAIFTAVAVLASYVPARAAARVDPLVALKHD